MNNIAYTMLDHQSGVIDILVSLMMLYPYHDLTVEYQPVLRKSGNRY